MFNEHDCFTTPPDDSRIWRYIDLAKFLSLLDKSSLWFTIPSELEDPWEGNYPRIHSDPKRLKDAYDQVPEYRDRKDKEAWIEFLMRIDVDRTRRQDTFRDTSAINCWHANKFESDAFWKLYASLGVGVAISSTIGALKRSLSGFPEPLYIGWVNYLDHEVEAIRDDNRYWPFLWKRLSFSHENEVRAIVDMGPDVRQKVTGLEYPDIYDKPSPGPIPPGRAVPVDLDALIDVIYVSPLAPPWLVDVVKSVTSKYALNKEVRRSDLLDHPFGTAKK